MILNKIEKLEDALSEFARDAMDNERKMAKLKEVVRILAQQISTGEISQKDYDYVVDTVEECGVYNTSTQVDTNDKAL